MAAAPQYATISLRSLKTGLTRSVDVYISDVLNALARFDSGAGAGSASDTFYTIPEDSILEDFSVVTGLTDTTNVSLTRNNVQTGNTFRYTIHLTSLNSRPKLSIPFRAGDKMGAIQR